jgi:prolyl oligopeptidase PreP (S9A serine peptidase family)
MESVRKYKELLAQKKEYILFKPARTYPKGRPLPTHQINKMRRMYEEGHGGFDVLAKVFNVSKSRVREIVLYHTNILDERGKSLIEMQNDGEIAI